MKHGNFCHYCNHFIGGHGLYASGSGHGLYASGAGDTTGGSLKSIGKAFKSGNVGKIFSPSANHNTASDLIHEGIPVATGSVVGAAGTAAGTALGGPVGGLAGGVAGAVAGHFIGKEIGDAVGKKTGYGIKKRRTKKQIAEAQPPYTDTEDGAVMEGEVLIFKTKKGGKGAWIAHVKAYAKLHKISYKQALKDAKDSYRGGKETPESRYTAEIMHRVNASAAEKREQEKLKPKFSVGLPPNRTLIGMSDPRIISHSGQRQPRGLPAHPSDIAFSVQPTSRSRSSSFDSDKSFNGYKHVVNLGDVSDSDGSDEFVKAARRARSKRTAGGGESKASRTHGKIDSDAELARKGYERYMREKQELIANVHDKDYSRLGEHRRQEDLDEIEEAYPHRDLSHFLGRGLRWGTPKHSMFHRKKEMAFGKHVKDLEEMGFKGTTEHRRAHRKWMRRKAIADAADEATMHPDKQYQFKEYIPKVRDVGNRRESKWVSHVKNFAKDKGISYKEALQHADAKESYRNGNYSDYKEEAPMDSIPQKVKRARKPKAEVVSSYNLRPRKGRGVSSLPFV